MNLNSMNEDEVANISDDEIVAAKKIESLNLTLEELENRLALGEIVEDEHTAYVLYCEYGRAKGFNVRKGKNLWNRKHDFLIGKLFFCSCEGFKDEKRSTKKIPEYQKTTARCGCSAKLKISRSEGESWRIATFKIEHNHELYAPDETYLLRSTRKLTDEQTVLFNRMVQSGISVTKAFDFMKNLAKGGKNLGFTRREVYDSIYREKRKAKIDEGDAIGLVQHFRNKSNNENNFYWNMEVEDDITLMNLFFRDSQCLIDYECFGDVLTFDTTYRTNKYGLVCAPFVGINHHKDNVFFGFALLSDETQSSFEWLFHTFLESMGGKQPQVIFTDQCQAMMNAICTIFPLTHHRLCQWHINQNAPSHFGSLNQDSTFKHLWTKCMSYCESEEEFEKTWQQMVDNYGIGEQNWFNMMYNLRHKWATAFSNHMFSAGLMATSRSEGTNTALKKEIGNSTSTLLNCIQGYEKVLSNWRTQEKINDSHCHHNQPTLLSRYNPILKQAADVYTHTIFHLFQIEHKDQFDYECIEEPTSAGSSLRNFKIVSYGASSRITVVEYNNDTSEIKCTCHKFDTLGILCKHVLRVFTQLNQRSILDRYIKKRWTMSAKDGLCNKSSRSIGDIRGNMHVTDMAFVDHMTTSMHDLAMRGKCIVAARDILIKSLDCACEQINSLLLGMNLNEDIEMLVRDPPIVKSRGITNIHKRHWDDKSKKARAKREMSKRATKGAKRRGQNSQTVGDECPSQEANNIQSSQVEATQPSQVMQSCQLGVNQSYPMPNTSQFVANQTSMLPMAPFVYLGHPNYPWRPHN